jgi:nucleoside-diphosphate-sugar epimerase
MEFNMRVLLTGPFGTIGTRVLNELLSRGHTVSCFDLDNKTEPQDFPALSF